MNLDINIPDQFDHQTLNTSFFGFELQSTYLSDSHQPPKALEVLWHIFWTLPAAVATIRAGIILCAAGLRGLANLSSSSAHDYRIQDTKFQ